MARRHRECMLRTLLIAQMTSSFLGLRRLRMQSFWSCASISLCLVKLACSTGHLEWVGMSLRALRPEHSVWTVSVSLMLARLQPAVMRLFAESLAELASLPDLPCMRPLRGWGVPDQVIHILGFSAGSLCALSIEKLVRLQFSRPALRPPPRQCRVGALACPPDLFMQLVNPMSGPPALLTRFRRLSILHVRRDALCAWHPPPALLQQLLSVMVPFPRFPAVATRECGGAPAWLGGHGHDYAHLLCSGLLDDPACSCLGSRLRS